MVNTVARTIRMGMVGEGQGTFIGPVQRMATDLDGQVELVCGAFSNEPKRADYSAEDMMLTPNRVYCDYLTMMAGEAQLPKHERMDFVCIVTPNHLHLPIARVALEAGFHVLCDKPATLNINEAKELAKLVKQSGCLYGLTHAYTDYPTAKEAHTFIRGFISDIARRAVNSTKYLMRKKITHVCAELSTFVAGRRLNDNDMMLLKMQNGINQKLQASLMAMEHAEGYIGAFANIYQHFARAIRCHEQGVIIKGQHWDYPQVAGTVRGMRLFEAFVESSQQKLNAMPLKKQKIKGRQHG